MKTVICTVCPRGCYLQVDQVNNYAVTGNSCQRGISYGQSELKHPVRILTSTVRIKGAIIPRLSVKTDRPLEKKLIPDCMKLLNRISVDAPIYIGEVIISNIFNSGINIVATKTLERIDACPSGKIV